MNPAVNVLHQAIGAAIHRDLSPITRKGPDGPVEVRPTEDLVEVLMFQETWPSTALGYGGLGGQAFTSAYTVIVIFSDEGLIYWGSDRLGYRVPAQMARWMASQLSTNLKTRKTWREMTGQKGPDDDAST